MLDDGFPAFTGREIDVDVGPGPAVLGEEAFEEQAPANGVAGGDFKTVTDCGVGSRAPSLAEDTLGLGELNQFPDDEKVSGKTEAGYEVEFMLKLSANLPGDLLVALACATEGQFPQEFAFFPRRERPSVLMVGRKLVSEVGESELEAIGEALGIEKRLGLITKEVGNLSGVLEVPFGICGEESSRLVKGGVMAKAGQSVGKESVAPDSEERSVGGEERDFKVIGEVDENPVATFLSADMVTSESEIEVSGSEGITKPGCCLEEDTPGRISLQEGFGSEKSYKAATSVGQ